MPSGPVTLHTKWCEFGPTAFGDVNAEEFLRNRGYLLTRKWSWIVPEGHIPTEEELSAVDYLILEWDFDGFEKRNSNATG